MKFMATASILKSELVLLLCITSYHVAAAVSSRIDVFTQTPVNPVLEGDTVVVWCIGTGSGQRWYINNIISQRLDDSEYMVRHYGDRDDDLWNTSLTFIATMERNETHIQCNLQGDSTHDSMGSTIVILAGPPSPPATRLEILNEGTVLQLSWTEPFSPTPYPVTYYCVVVYNDTISTDNVLVNVSINSTQHHYDFIKTNNTAACQVFIFAASATSDIGTSNVSTMVGTFSIIPNLNDFNISHEVDYVNGITPRLTVWFKEPSVCSLQEQVNYTLDVLDENGLVASSGLLEARGGSDGRVFTTFTNLRPNSTVSIRLTFMHSTYSWAQTFKKENISIEPSISSNIGTQTSTEEGTIMMQSPPSSNYPMDVNATSSSQNISTTVIIITVASIIAVMILIGVIIIVPIVAAIILVTRRKLPVHSATDISPIIYPPSSNTATDDTTEMKLTTFGGGLISQPPALFPSNYDYEPMKEDLVNPEISEQFISENNCKK